MEKNFGKMDKEMDEKKLNWDEYFIQIADAVSKRATCNRGKSGCVVVRDRHILVTGYVGAPSGLPHCDDVGHHIVFEQEVNKDGEYVESEHCVRTVHAEQNAICQAAKLGVSLDGATLYCRMTPCRSCAMMIINCGIKRVVCEWMYKNHDDTEDMFRRVGIELVYINKEVLKYDEKKKPV